MAEYRVRAKEVLTEVFTVEAQSEEEALNKVEEMYKENDMFLTYENFYGDTEFEIDGSA